MAAFMRPADVPGEITDLLLRHRGGDRDAFDRLVTMVYHELRSIARRQLGWRRRGDMLDTTALVHEAPEAREFVAQAVREIRRKLSDHPASRSRLLTQFGQKYVLLGRYPEAIEVLEESLATRRALFGGPVAGGGGDAGVAWNDPALRRPLRFGGGEPARCAPPPAAG